MYWADSLGSNYICSRLEEWSETYGDFFKPCAYLAQRAAKGIPLVRNPLNYYYTIIIKICIADLKS
jgi:hypothetical protein